MKNILPVLFTAFYFTAFSQDTLRVNEVENTFSMGRHNSFSVNIPQANIKEVSFSWKKYQRDKNKSDYKSEKGENKFSKTIIPEISTDSVTIYSILTSTSNHVNLSVMVTLNDSDFISSTTNPSVSSRLSNYIRTFAVGEYRKAVYEELSREKNKLKDIEREMEDLEKSNVEMEKEIKKNERTINNLESDIKSNLNEQEVNDKMINQQQQIVGVILEKSELKKEQEKKLKDLENTKKKLQKQKDKMSEKIDELEVDNKSLRKKIELNEDKKLVEKKNEREQQKLLVATIEVKFKNIY